MMVDECLHAPSCLSWVGLISGHTFLTNDSLRRLFQLRRLFTGWVRSTKRWGGMSSAGNASSFFLAGSILEIYRLLC